MKNLFAKKSHYFIEESIAKPEIWNSFLCYSFLHLNVLKMFSVTIQLPQYRSYVVVNIYANTIIIDI